MANTSEAERDPLVTLVSADSSAFLLLYDIYYEKIFYHCLTGLHSKQITEDMTSVVFVQAARNIRRFRGRTRTDFVNWLSAIATDQINRSLKDKEFAELVSKIAVDTALTPDAGHEDKLRAKILAAFDSADKNISRIFLYSAIAAVILIAIGILLRPAKTPIQQIATPQQQKKTVTPPSPIIEIKSYQEIPKSRLEIIEQLADEDNIPELLKILKEGDSTARLLAAKFLAELTDSNIADILKLGGLPSPVSDINTAQPAVGGVVKNQELEPIKDAEVKVLVNFSNNTETSNNKLLGVFKTDANGIWRCGNFPKNAAGASITAAHPNYVPMEIYQQAAIEQLKNFSFETILERGVTVIGRTVDRQQNPLQATIIRGPFESGSENSQICDADGWFRFDNVMPGVEVFTAQYAGAKPQVLPVEIKADMPPVIFTLEAGSTIRGRVVDINDSPIENTSVKVSSWQGVNSLNFETKTDANGYFEWLDAPEDEVLFDIQKNGYMSVRKFAMKSEDDDYVITLLLPFVINGNVTSSEADKPVETFKITPGYYFDNVNISWQESISSTFSGNTYELTITEPIDFQLKLQADGFEPAESPIFSPDQDIFSYDFVLDPIKTQP
ncbi:MAG: carboxypeptidase regulatory-like domain-containing protein [Planctomycetes bacterium]|nr:carboxypeptidase regulatory-like domain-containing protein [Planctomycetota bacterium]MBU2597180.1 carboxypeptidase regulatory-like domain-containing protein [Planctomycetota bacterium]